MPSLKYTIRDLVRMAKDIESCAGRLGMLEEGSRVVLEEGSLGPSPQVRPSAYNAFQVPTLIPSGTEVLFLFPYY